MDDFVAATAVDMEKMVVSKHGMDIPVPTITQTTANHSNNNNNNNRYKNGTKESTGQRTTGKGAGLRVYTGSEMDETADRNTPSRRLGTDRQVSQGGGTITAATVTSSSSLSPRAQQTTQESSHREQAQRIQLQNAVTPNMTSGARTNNLRRGFHNQTTPTTTTTTTTVNNNNSTATSHNNSSNSSNNNNNSSSSNVGPINRGTGQKSTIDTRKNLTQPPSQSTKQQQPSSSSSSSLSSRQQHGVTSTINNNNNNNNKTITNSSGSSSKNTTTPSSSSNKTLSKSLPRTSTSKGVPPVTAMTVASGNHQVIGMYQKYQK